MTAFRQAVEKTPNLGPDAFNEGLGALAKPDKQRLTVNAPQALCGSVNLDERLKKTAPQAARWDYAVCHGSKPPRVHWIEVHPASDYGVSDVQKKIDWLRLWLNEDGRRLAKFDRAFVWISSGSTTFTRTSPAARRLAQAGVIAAGRHYSIS